MKTLIYWIETKPKIMAEMAALLYGCHTVTIAGKNFEKLLPIFNCDVNG